MGAPSHCINKTSWNTVKTQILREPKLSKFVSVLERYVACLSLFWDVGVIYINLCFMNSNAYGDCARLFTGRDWTSVTRCDLSARQCSPTQRTSETSVAAVISLRNCEPPTPNPDLATLEYNFLRLLNNRCQNRLHGNEKV